MVYLVTLIHPISDVRFALERADFDDRAIEQINDAWGKSLALQVALWTRPYVREGDW